MRIGVQLYAFKRPAVETDLAAILSQLQQIGYEAVEGLPGHVVDYRAILDDLGMSYAASHLMLETLEDPKPVLQFLDTMSGHDICSSGPLKQRDANADDYHATCAFMNAAGRELRKAGVHLHYHNHEFEFAALPDGTRGMDILVDGLDPSAADLCFDAGWAWMAGVDPAAFMRQHAGLVGYVHLRDFAGRQSAALGQGDIDLAPVIAAACDLPRLRWLIVEHDPTSDRPLEDLALSRRYLRERFGL